ncbi:uncharacterized protein B0T15DRAFT_490738 [Chaetomium strumarium]|uniref:Uncharacterized protein n=1 Tax=Chaetomium strumarium TaxID=1170767 RepID=A0AAJ0GXX1_9PEZI|nr:hypothetical protein B0T15DRAFT_490738 [Chaetomium strumarium]
MIHTTENSTANQPGAPDYKAKLDEAASGAKNPANEGEGSGIIDKVSQYVSVVGKMLGKEPEQEQTPTESTPSAPPERTKHDTQIEEFIRDQHLSRKVAEPEEPQDM